MNEILTTDSTSFEIIVVRATNKFISTGFEPLTM